MNTFLILCIWKFDNASQPMVRLYVNLIYGSYIKMASAIFVMDKTTFKLFISI